MGDREQTHRSPHRMADHGMQRPQPFGSPLDCRDEFHRRKLAARRLAVCRHVKRHGGEAARQQRVDDRPELRAIALEAMDQKNGRPSAPSPGNKTVAQVHALVGGRKGEHRRRLNMTARIQHQTPEEKRHEPGRHVTGSGEGGDRDRTGGHGVLPNRCSCT